MWKKRLDVQVELGQSGLSRSVKDGRDGLLTASAGGVKREMRKKVVDEDFEELGVGELLLHEGGCGEDDADVESLKAQQGDGLVGEGEQEDQLHEGVGLQLQLHQVREPVQVHQVPVLVVWIFCLIFVNVSDEVHVKNPQ